MRLLSTGSRNSPSVSTKPIVRKASRLYPHIHEEFEFFVLAEGSGTLLIDGVPFSLSQGEGAFVNSRCIHLGTPLSSDPAFFYAIVFSPQIFGSYVNDIVIDKYVAPVIHRSWSCPSYTKEKFPGRRKPWK